MRSEAPYIEIGLREQRLWLRQGDRVVAAYLCSTSRNGPGEMQDSECTPRGWHAVHAKIGDDCVPGTVFVGRRPTGEIYCSELGACSPGRDWILTRILWLSGLEPGRNQGGNVDSKNRYIYIHGAPDDASMGVPGSRGCVRLRSNEIIDLFNRVAIGTRVYIRDHDTTAPRPT